MLVTNRPAGDTAEMNLINPLSAVINQVSKGIQCGIQTQDPDVLGYHTMTDALQKIRKKELILPRIQTDT